MWFTTSMVLERYDGEPSEWKLVSREKEDGGKLFSSLWSLVFLWDPNILPSFIKNKERKRKKASLVLQRYFFFDSPATSLLPPSESFRIEKDHLMGEVLRRKRYLIYRDSQTFSECLSLFLIRYICKHRYYCDHKENAEPTQNTDQGILFSGCS